MTKEMSYSVLHVSVAPHCRVDSHLIAGLTRTSLQGLPCRTSLQGWPCRTSLQGCNSRLVSTNNLCAISKHCSGPVLTPGTLLRHGRSAQSNTMNALVNNYYITWYKPYHFYLVLLWLKIYITDVKNVTSDSCLVMEKIKVSLEIQ